MRFGGAGLWAPGVMALALSLGGAARAQTAFTDWESVLKPGATVAVGGVSQEFTYTSGAGGVTAVKPPSTNMAATFTETFSAAGDITSMVVQNANRTVGFYTANRDTIASVADGDLIYGLSSDWTRKAIAADPLSNGWEYQSFGVWVSGLGQAQGSMGAASVGAITPGTSVPQTGSATFTGLMGGIYNDAAGQDHIVAAGMTLAMNFAAHAGSFRTTNTVDMSGRRYSELDITGTFLSLPNHPALFGTLNTQRLTGTSSGQFYGPAAQEVGGVFTLTPKSGQGLERLAGAFGGSRLPPNPPAGPFETFRSIRRGATTTVSGFAIAGSYTADGAGHVQVGALARTDAQYAVTVNENAGVAGLQIATQGQTLAFSPAAGDSLVNAASGNGSAFRVFDARSSDGRARALFADPFSFNLQSYQTFGAWQTGVGLTGGALGAFSVGSATPASGMPTSGTKNAGGYAVATYVDENGNARMATANVAVYFDTGSRRGRLESSEFTALGGTSPISGTGLIAQIQMASGATSVVTVVNARNTSNVVGMTGTLTAQFYGPNANEVGGVFDLTASAGPRRLTGAFGAK